MGWNDRMSERELYSFCPETYRATYDKATPDSMDKNEYIEKLKAERKRKEQSNEI